MPGEEVPWQDIRGGIHVHSAAGGHSLGTYDEIIAAAKQASYRYLFITEHPKPNPDLAPVADPDLTLIYGYEKQLDSVRVLTDAGNQVRFLTHFARGEMPQDLTGMELVNLHEAAARKNRWYQGVNFLYHRLLFPEIFYFHLWSAETLQLLPWDREMQRRPVTGIAGNDAHQNVGLVLQTTAGRKLFTLQLDPYLQSFRFVSTHLFLPPGQALNQGSVLQALKKGSAYIALEGIADPTGFSFHALGPGGVQPMGSRVAKGTVLIAQSPIPIRFTLLKNGREHRELEGERLVFTIEEPGAYRVVLYPLHPPSLLKDTPWIISNPIFAG